MSKCLQPGRCWQRFRFSYEQQDELLYVYQSDQSGLAKKQCFDRLGYEVRRQLNGELQCSQHMVSDSSIYIEKASRRMRLANNSTGSGGAGSAAISIGEKESMPHISSVAARIEQDAQGNRIFIEYDCHHPVASILFADVSEICSYAPTSKYVSEEIDENG